MKLPTEQEIIAAGLIADAEGSPTIEDVVSLLWTIATDRNVAPTGRVAAANVLLRDARANAPPKRVDTTEIAAQVSRELNAALDQLTGTQDAEDDGDDGGD